MAYTQAQKDWYERNKEQVAAASRKAQQKRYAAVAKIKEESPCSDCGKNWPAIVMAFHHRPGTKKVGDISRLLRSRGLKTVLTEIEKCDLLCANCHMLRHHSAGEYGRNNGS